MVSYSMPPEITTCSFWIDVSNAEPFYECHVNKRSSPYYNFKGLIVADATGRTNVTVTPFPHQPINSLDILSNVWLSNLAVPV